MQACRNQNEILMLDALGELNDPRMRREWQDHLNACDGCRRERARMLNLLAKVKRAGMPPDLSEEQADAMARTISWKLRNERMKPFKEAPRRFRPVLAAACAVVLIVMVGYYFKERHSESARETAMSAEVMPSQDLEVIKHLDLLKDMDTIEKLVHVVDVPENGAGPEQGAPETQGMKLDEGEKIYA